MSAFVPNVRESDAVLQRSCSVRILKGIASHVRRRGQPSHVGARPRHTRHPTNSRKVTKRTAIAAPDNELRSRGRRDRSEQPHASR